MFTDNKIANLINGQEVFSDQHSSVYDSATGAVCRTVCLADDKILNDAVGSAKEAFGSWSKKPAIARARIINDYLQLLKANKRKLAEIISQEHGKVIDDAIGEIERGIEIVEFATSVPYFPAGSYSDRVASSVDTHTFRQPLGVCVGITPFNFPVMVPMWMYAVAIATGNTFVLKPSPLDPGASLMIAKLFLEAGLPPGVFNVVNSEAEGAKALMAHRDVAAVSFVGSTTVAKSVYEQCAQTGKRVQALGGAKNHLVVMPDADLDSAAAGLLGAGFGSAGQRCMAISVAVLVAQVAEPLLQKLIPMVQKLKIGRGYDSGSEMGPVISKSAAERILQLVDSGVTAGADLLVDGRGYKHHDYPNGYWVGPCLFDQVTAEMEIYQQEIFGPVLCCVRVDDFDQALELINSNRYANGTSIYTSSGAIANAFAREVEVGMIGVNVPIPVPVAQNGFGGFKDSLFGDTHVYGREGINFYTKQKSVMQRWDRNAVKQLIMPTTK